MNPPLSDAEAIQLVQDVRTVNYVVVAALTLLVYDHLLMFQDEVELIWDSSPWKSYMRFFYFWARYCCASCTSVLAIFRLIIINSAEFCATLHKVDALMELMIITTIDMVMALKIWLLYGKAVRPLFIMIPLIIVEVVVMSLVDKFFVPSGGGNRYATLGPILAGCHSSHFSRITTVYAVPPLLTTFVMFCLTLHKCLENSRNIQRRMPITWLFLRDGIVWFTCIQIIMIATLVNWAVGRVSLIQITHTPSLVAYVVLSSHALLNVKRVLHNLNPPITTHYDTSYGCEEYSTS